MQLTKLSAVSPIDGRYRDKVEPLASYFSEYALMKYRVHVEVEYFIALCLLPLPQLKNIHPEIFESLKAITKNFSESDATRIKELEKKTNHDVKSVEYFLKEKFSALGLDAQKEFIHFGLTSQDINNTATPLLIKDAFNQIYVPMVIDLFEQLGSLAKEWKSIPMLAHTHGQPASPTHLGKEIFVFVERLNNQLQLIQQIPFTGKFGGATGNFNAHFVSYPDINWNQFADIFLEKQLGLKRQHFTTQIEHYDNLAALFDNLKRINNIMIDLCRDFWTYISMDYFKQKINPDEVGSSAMPHKVNPIDFENAEGNLGMANAIFEHLSSKLPVSRLQRDLTDSTVLRNVGVPFAHTIISIQSIQKGLAKLIVNENKIKNDLEENWMVISEAIQTILRREGVAQPFEQLKELTRKNSSVTKEVIHQFIDQLAVSSSVKDELKRISPHNYTGITQ